MKTISRYIMTLALLITAVTGAWAQSTLNVVELEVPAAWKGDENLVTAGDLPGFKASTKTEAEAWTGVPAEGIALLFYAFKGDEAYYVYFENGAYRGGEQTTIMKDGIFSLKSAYRFYYTASDAITVAWTASTKTGTFAMPGSDVVLTPIYAKAATFATTGSGSEAKTQLPEAAEGVIAGTDDPLIKKGTGIVAFAGESTEVTQGTLMYAVTPATVTEAPALDAANKWSATVPTAETVADDGADVHVWYYIQGADAPEGDAATLDNTFSDTEPACLTVQVLSNKFDIQLNAANANTIEAGKATVTVAGAAATVTDGKLQGVKMGSEVKLEAKPGYKFRKVEVKKGGGEPVLLTTITAADNSSFKSGSQTFGDVATVTLTGNGLTNDGSHGGWYCLGSNLTATISVAAANGANITSVKFYTAGGGSAEDKDAPFEVTTTSMSSSNITTYLNGNSIGSYGVSKIEVYGTK